MVNSEKQRSSDDREIEGVDRANDDGFDDSSTVETSGIGTSVISGGSRDDGGSVVGAGLTERLTDSLVDEGDGDLLLQQSDRVIQFLQALDLRVMGACRAGQRLKPLLKLSCDVAEDLLLAHLSQHFEASEVDKQARCLCIPLVSIRVGKTNKQGTLLYPNATRSFIGDDHHTERLSTVISNSQCSAAAVEEIPADESGRSFLIKIPDDQVFYFWCSEKSKLLGNELIMKMQDLLKKKPSLAELTGISESRLDCFATHLRSYLVGSSLPNTRASWVVALAPPDTSSYSSELCQTAQSSSSSSKPLHSQHVGSQSGKNNSIYQGSLSPRSSSFKEGLPRNFSSLRSVAREKLRRWDSQFSVIDNLSVTFASYHRCIQFKSFWEGQTSRSYWNALILSRFIGITWDICCTTPFESSISSTFFSFISFLFLLLLVPSYCINPAVHVNSTSAHLIN